MHKIQAPDPAEPGEFLAIEMWNTIRPDDGADKSQGPPPYRFRRGTAREPLQINGVNLEFTMTPADQSTTAEIIGFWYDVLVDPDGEELAKVAGHMVKNEERYLVVAVNDDDELQPTWETLSAVTPDWENNRLRVYITSGNGILAPRDPDDDD